MQISLVSDRVCYHLASNCNKKRPSFSCSRAHASLSPPHGIGRLAPELSQEGGLEIVGDVLRL